MLLKCSQCSYKQDNVCPKCGQRLVPEQGSPITTTAQGDIIGVGVSGGNIEIAKTIQKAITGYIENVPTLDMYKIFKSPTLDM
jgi:hypothetical protein